MVALSGVAVAYRVWVAAPGTALGLQKRFAPLHTFFANKWYFDELIDLLVVRPALGIGRFANRVFERFVIDGLITGGTEETIGRAGGVVRAVQNGFVRTYALFLLAGVVGLVTYFLIQQS